MNIHLKIKECVAKRGAEIIVTNTLISILDDEQVFDEIETLPYKKILRNIIKEGYTRRLLDLGGYTPEVNFLVSQYAQENFMQEAPIQYVFDCLSYGLGWTSDEPTLQTLVSQAEKAKEEAEEKIRKGKEFYKLEKYDKAFLYLKEGLEVVEDAEAQYYLGVLYEEGEGVDEDVNEAMEWFHKAAEQGHVNAQFRLGDLYEWLCIFGECDMDEAVKWYRMAAEQGDVDAQDKLKELASQNASDKIRKGKEFYKSEEYDKAFLYLKEGLQFVSDVEAEFILGSLYETGKGVSMNGMEAAKWYRIAAEKGYANAQYALGGMYDSTNIFNIGGLVSDDVEAVKWYRKAAEQGHASAQYALGCMYDNGTGVVKNVSEAMIWYKRAADRGLAAAQCFLGLHYFNERNYAEAVNWLRKAAKQGHGSATSTLKSLARQGLPAAQACFDSNGNLK